jgi:hypothetical protein
MPFHGLFTKVGDCATVFCCNEFIVSDYSDFHKI